jgi:hypothetical protein
MREQGEHPMQYPMPNSMPNSMPTSDECRKIADEYDRLASEAKTETDRLALLDLARTWLEAASRRDEMTPAQIAAAEKPFSAPPPKRKGWRRLVSAIFG